VTRQIHQRCPRCGRLLVPVHGHMPAHRTPPPKPPNYGTSVPLTGRDALWCAAGRWT
jgi:hypothetical protein